jgi:protein arginine kinase activator
MKCQFCDNPATVHLTKIVNKKKREVRLCEACARKRNLLPAPPQAGAPAIDLKALLGLLVGPLQPGGADPGSLTCPTCGLQYAEFRAEGRLGCPADYDAFRPLLEPLLERIHRSLGHAGKVPVAVRRHLRDAELDDLRRRMQAAVADERYEEAARLRDLIRQKEVPDEPR